MGQVFQRLLGTPAFGLQTENTDASFRLQFWFYPPPSKFSEDNTVLCTVGLSQRYFEGACPWIELMFQVPGRHARPQLEKLGVVIGEVLFNTLKVTRFTPNLLLTSLRRPLLPNMRDILVVEGAGLRPLWMETDDRNIQILHLLPVYQEEVPLIRKMGFWNTYRRFIEQEVDFLSPNRPKLVDTQFHPDEQRLAREVSIYQGGLSIEKIWRDIQGWYQANAPRVPAAQLPGPPAALDNWEDSFGLTASFPGKKPPEDPENWLEEHWERLYAGGFLPGLEETLSVNPHFYSPT